MATLIKGFINLTKCNNKAYLKKLKNQDTIVNVDIWLNDEADKYDNTVSISLSQSKEQREAKEPKVYIGNGKPSDFKKNTGIQDAIVIEIDKNDLPY